MSAAVSGHLAQAAATERKPANTELVRELYPASVVRVCNKVATLGRLDLQGGSQSS